VGRQSATLIERALAEKRLESNAQTVKDSVSQNDERAVRAGNNGQVSIKDIARAAGVHHSTVSRALHGVPLIKKETADRIRRIAADAGFTVSAVARSLATQKSRMIGVVVTMITDPFHHEIISGLDQVADERGYSVILADSQADSERELRVVRSFNERRVDAIVVMSSRVGARYVPLMSERKVPIVLINSQRHDDFVHSVTIDNVESAYVAVRHLTELGHRRIAYLGNQLGVYSDPERFSGYRQALADANIAFQPELVVHSDYSPEGSAQAMKRLLTGKNRPSAVFCYNDVMALGALHGARGIARVPNDVSLVGFDDLFFAPFLDPPLTTIRQPKKEMGRLAMELVLKLLAGQESRKTVHVHGELIVRSSTAPPEAPGRVSPRPK
jgi:DNA-binding LacI/PurR family transcriptional regulator